MLSKETNEYIKETLIMSVSAIEMYLEDNISIDKVLDIYMVCANLINIKLLESIITKITNIL